MHVYTTAGGVVRRDDHGSSLLCDFASIDEILAAGWWDQIAELPAVAINPEHIVPLPPVQPTNLVIVGLNYRSHAEEVGQPVPAAPLFACIDGGAVLASDAAIPAPPEAPEQVDYEGEVAVVLARPAHRVSATEAWSVVAGVTAINDVTARDLQLAAVRRGDGLGIAASKSFPGFKPLGPAILAVDGDVRGIGLTTRVNGEVRQSAALTDLIFDIPALIEAITATVALNAGDVISTGSPAGVGLARGQFLNPGDTVEVTVGSLPPLRNTYGVSRRMGSDV